MRALITITVFITAMSTPTCYGQTTSGPDLESRIEELDQRLRTSERKREIREEEAEAAAKLNTTTNIGSGGYQIRSGDGNFQIALGADLQVDNRTFFGKSSTAQTDSILIRRLRPRCSGTVYKFVDFYVRADFGQGTTSVNEGYIDLKYFPRAVLRVGKFKPPVGLERLHSDDDTNFPERGLPTLLVPSRDVGYQLSGDLLPRKIAYAVGVFNGVPDNGTGTDVSASGHRDYAARVFLTPLGTKLGLGVAATRGAVEGLALPSYRSFSQGGLLSFNTGVTAAGHRTRLAPQAYFYHGGFGVLAEYTVSRQGFRRSTLERDVTFRAWQVQAAYLFTGEQKYFTTLTPLKAFDPLKRTWGAFEVVGRVGDFSAQRGIYDYGFADPTRTPRRAHEWVVGGNWYLNRNVKVSVDYGETRFAGGAVGGDRSAERVIVNRFQLNF